MVPNRNGLGRFRRSSNRSSNRNRTRKNRAINVRVNSPDEFQKVIRKKGLRIMINISNDTCPHCVNYKPKWNSLASTAGRNVPMISTPSSIYNDTEIGKKLPINSVPSVVLVDESGEVHEVKDIHNMPKMEGLLKDNNTSNMSNKASNMSNKPSNMSNKASNMSNKPSNMSNKPSNMSPNMSSNMTIHTGVPIVSPVVTKEVMTPVSELKAILPGVTMNTNPLTPIPGTPLSSEMPKQQGVQTGGNPWAAFLMAAKQAAPAAALLGVYAALPERSSGLKKPRKSRKSKV